MIDTVVLMLNPSEFEIFNHDRFSPSTVNLFTHPRPRLGKGGVFKCTQNPTKEESKLFGYMPRLTAIMRPCNVTRSLVVSLKIEFSAPKILHGNNFDELADSDFPKLLGALTTKLFHMGVKTTPEKLRSAQVSAVHYSKNFMLADHTRCRHVLDELQKLKIWHQLDATAKDYRNQGHLLKWHGNSYELCFYDKIKDLEQAKISGKRAVDPYQEGQFPLLDLMQEQQQQVLRMELRLTKKKLKSLLTEMGSNRDTTFAELYSSNLSQKILISFWDKIDNQAYASSVLQADLSSPEKYIEKLLATYPDIKPKDATAMIGTAIIMQRTGEAGFEAIFGRSQQRSARRLIVSCKARQPKSNPRWQAAAQVQEQLKKFEPTTLPENQKRKVQSCR